MRTTKVFIAHNQYSHANPQVTSPTGNMITFHLHRVSEELRQKLFGKIEIVELTDDEMHQVLAAASGRASTVGVKTLQNLGLR